MAWNFRWNRSISQSWDRSKFVFFYFSKNSKIQNGRHFWGEKFFWKLPRVHFLDTLWVETFDKIALSCTVKEIEPNLCFSIFGKNSKIQNGRHFWGRQNFFWKLPSVHCLDTLWVEIFDKIALSCTVKEGQKFENSKWPPFLGRANFFWSVHCLDTLWVKKISTKSLYLAQLRRSNQICVFSIFDKNSKNSKWPPFLGRGKFFENCQEYIASIPYGSDEIALSGTVKEIEPNLCFSIFGKNSKWPPLLGRGNFF